MKLSEIKTELFTRVTLTDFGIKFEYYNKDKHEKSKNKIFPPFFFIIIICLLKNGSVNFQMQHNNHLSAEQLDEIQRCSEFLRGQDNDN